MARTLPPCQSATGHYRFRPYRPAADPIGTLGFQQSTPPRGWGHHHVDGWRDVLPGLKVHRLDVLKTFFVVLVPDLKDLRDAIAGRFGLVSLPLDGWRMELMIARASDSTAWMAPDPCCVSVDLNCVGESKVNAMAASSNDSDSRHGSSFSQARGLASS
jgi:hypothetical protein